ncbi:MAG: hypothetical protein U9R06_00525 [Patescibacteria group bacterium]|nr:hypothetical protein [Patescibacteria group bacterium]
MRICYFGIYNAEYARNKVLIMGLKENNCEVVQCNVDPRKRVGFKKFIKLIRKYREINNKNFDYMLVGYPGQTVVWLAKLLFRGPIIFDAFFSVYDSLVFDRKSCKPYSLTGIWNWFLDWYSCSLADTVLLDTNEHIKYFIKEFRIKKVKFIRILIGADTTIFRPKKYE